MKDLNKILSGNILVQTRNNILTVRQPDATTRYLADFFCEQVYEDAFSKNIYLQEELEELIIENGWWTQDEEDELKQIPKDIEQMKLDYFNSFLRDNTKTLIKKAIRKKEDRFEELTKDKYMFFNYTCESLKSQAYTMYILEHCTFYENGDKISLVFLLIFSASFFKFSSFDVGIIVLPVLVICNSANAQSPSFLFSMSFLFQQCHLIQILIKIAHQRIIILFSW